MLYTARAREDQSHTNTNVAEACHRKLELHRLGDTTLAPSDEIGTETVEEAKSHKEREAAEHAGHASGGHRGTSRRQPPREITDGREREQRVAASAKRMTADAAAAMRSGVRAPRRFVVRGGEKKPEGRLKERRFELGSPAIARALGQAGHPPKGHSTPQRFEIDRRQRAPEPLPVQPSVVPGVMHACVSPDVVPIGGAMSGMPRQVSARTLNNER